MYKVKIYAQNGSEIGSSVFDNYQTAISVANNFFQCFHSPADVFCGEDLLVSFFCHPLEEE